MTMKKEPPKVTFYEPGTSKIKPVYLGKDKRKPASQPIKADKYGAFPRMYVDLVKP